MVPGLLPCDEKCASVLEKFRAKKRSPKKKNANFTQNSPLMANLLLLLPEKRGYFYRSPFLGVRSNRIEKCQFGKWWYSSLLYYQLTTNYYLTPKQKRG